MKRWQRIDEGIARVEQFFLALSLSLMVIVAFLQIVLRNLFTTGLPWADELVRYCVIWVGFLGAALATKEGKHIGMDVVSRWVSGTRRRALQGFTHLVSAVVSAALAVAAVKFVRVEVQMGTKAFFGLASWIVQIVIPITFGTMTIRYACFAIAELIKIVYTGLSQDDA